jgi:tetratricopeptide (TPR) repeat protein
VHFLYATSLKQIGRGADALSQVLALLEEQHSGKTRETDTLTYWQRRAGNEIANQFYQEGEPLKALDIYLILAALGSSPEWQLPVWYQLGLVYERLNQPAKALEYYGNIARREKELPPTATPSLKAVIEMARWRTDFLGWRVKTEKAGLEFRSSLGDAAAAPASPVTAPPLHSKDPSL